jgi:tetratricopeptide (TPR) repeat protein
VAEQAYRDKLALFEKLATEFPAVPGHRAQVGYVQGKLGEVFQRQGKLPVAEQAYRDKLALFERLAAEFPAVPGYRAQQGHAHRLLGFLWRAQGKLKEAEAAFRRAAPVFEELMLSDKTDASHSNYLADTLVALATRLTRTGRGPEAKEHLLRAVELNPSHTTGTNNLAWLLATHPDPKLRDPTRAVELGKKAVQLAPKQGYIWNTLGVACYRAGAWKDAIAALTQSMKLARGGTPTDWLFLAMTHQKLGQEEEARRWYDRAVERMDRNRPANPEELRRFRSEAEEVLGVNETAGKKEGGPMPLR